MRSVLRRCRRLVRDDHQPLTCKFFLSIIKTLYNNYQKPQWPTGGSPSAGVERGAGARVGKVVQPGMSEGIRTRIQTYRFFLYSVRKFIVETLTFFIL